MITGATGRETQGSQVAKYGGTASAYFRVYNRDNRTAIHQQLAQMGLLPSRYLGNVGRRQAEEAEIDQALAKLDSDPALAQKAYDKIGLSTQEARDAFIGKEIMPGSGTTPASRASARIAQGLPATGIDTPVGYTQKEAEDAYLAGKPVTLPRVSAQQMEALKTTGTPIPDYAKTATQIQDIPGLGKLTTTSKTPGQTGPTGYYKVKSGNTGPDGKPIYDVYDTQGRHIELPEFKQKNLNIDQIQEQDLKGLYERTGITPPKPLTAEGGTGAGGKAGPVYQPTKDDKYAKITDAYSKAITKLSELEAKLLAISKPSDEEKVLLAEVQKKRDELAQFDVQTLSRIEGYSGQGRGATLGSVVLNQEKERRTRALERLGMATEAQSIVDSLSLAQDARKEQTQAVKDQMTILDAQLGIQDKLLNLSRQEANDARTYLLDVIDFSEGKNWDELDAETQQSIVNEVAKSPLTLDMVKTALARGKEEQFVSDASKLRDDSRAVLSTVLNQHAGKSFGELSKTEQDSLIKLASDSGFPLSLLISGMEAVKSEQLRKDSDKNENQNLINQYQPMLEQSKKGGQYFDGNEYLRLRTEFASKTGSTSDFDDAFRPFLSPSDRLKYGLGGATESQADEDIAGQAKSTVTQYKDAGYDRDAIEKLYSDQGVDVPLEVEKALDEVFGEKPSFWSKLFGS